MLIQYLIKQSRKPSGLVGRLIAAALDKIGKYTRSDKEDEKFDYSQLVPPSFEPSDDVTLLEGLEPIENLEEERIKMRSMFKGMLSKKAVDTRPIEEKETEE